METMKKQWGKALTSVQEFVPQYCQTPCGPGETYWTGTCDYTGYAFKDLNNNKVFDRTNSGWTDEGSPNAYDGTNTSEGHRVTMTSDPSKGTMIFLFKADQIYRDFYGSYHVRQGEEPWQKGYWGISEEDNKEHFIVYNTITPHNPS